MRYELKRIEIWPVAKIVFILSLFLGVFIGILYGAFFAILSTVSTPSDAFWGGSDIPFGGMAIFIFIMCATLIPMLYTLFAVIFVSLYNLIAAWLGGFRVEFEIVDDSKKTISSVG